MFYRTHHPRDVFAELDRLQREMQEAVEYSPSIRGLARGAFPPINVGSTPHSLEIYAFAPGIDPASVDVQFERGALAIAGERKPLQAAADSTMHIAERFSGGFRRVVSLPDDINPDSIEANYRDGVLHIAIKRKEEAQPRRINIK